MMSIFLRLITYTVKFIIKCAHFSKGQIIIQYLKLFQMK
jgi:hypothetical protein